MKLPAMELLPNLIGRIKKNNFLNVIKNILYTTYPGAYSNKPVYFFLLQYGCYFGI